MIRKKYERNRNQECEIVESKRNTNKSTILLIYPHQTDKETISKDQLRRLHSS